MKSQLLIKGSHRAAMMMLATLAAAMTSCIKDNVQDVQKTLPDLPQGKVRIGLYTSSGDYQTPTTRAAAKEDLDAAAMPWVFVFTGNDGDAVFAEVKHAQPGATDDDPPYVVLTQQASAVKTLIVANAPEMFFDGSAEYDFSEEDLTDALKGKTFTEAVDEILNTVKLTTSPTTTTIPYVTPQSLNLPMTGTYDLAEIASGTTIGSDTAEIELTRVVAKVTVENSAAGFTLASASVVGAGQFGRLHQTSPFIAMTGNGTVDFEADIVKAAGPAGKETTTESPLYIYESASGTTSVIIKGSYNGTEGYYRLAFKSKGNEGITDGTILAVKRNKHYKFEITSVSGLGYGTFAEAAAAAVSNTGITSEVKVIDLSSHDIIDNGKYYLGVSNSEFIAFSDDALTDVVAVTVSTNATADMLGTLGTNTVTATSGLTVSTPTTGKLTLSADGKTAAVTELKFGSFPGSVTSGTITIKLGNLQKTIKVTRHAPLEGAASATEFEGVYAAGKVESQGTCAYDWLSLSLDGATSEGSEVTCTDGTPGNIYLMTEYNFPSDRSEGVAYLYRHDNSGRVKLYVKQKGLGLPIASPGVIGYIHNPGHPDHHTLTVSGSKEYAGTKVETHSTFGPLSQHTVLVAYFKWGSLIAIGSDGGDDDIFDSEDVICGPDEYSSKLSTLKTDIEAASGNAKWGKVQYKFGMDWPNEPAEYEDGFGNPCVYYFNLKMPTRWAAYANRPFGASKSDWPLYNGARFYNAGNETPVKGAVAGGAGASTNEEDWSMFLPVTGRRSNQDGKVSVQDINGYYWSSAKNVDSGYFLDFNSSEVTPGTSVNCARGNAVRCVQVPPYLTATRTGGNGNVPGTGGTATFEVDTNAPAGWTATVTSGVGATLSIGAETPATTITGPTGTTTVTLTFDANPTFATRSATVTFTATGVDDEVLTVTQAMDVLIPGSNCYMIMNELNPKTLVIPISQVGFAMNGEPGSRSGFLGSDWITDYTKLKTQVLWSDVDEFGTEGAVVKSVEYNGATSVFKGKITVVPGSGTGNAGIILYEDNDGMPGYKYKEPPLTASDDKIIWSWHIWKSDYYPYNADGTANTKVSPNTNGFMDRNLGATSAEPGDIETAGLIYQWGRKDPYPGASAWSNTSATFHIGPNISSYEFTETPTPTSPNPNLSRSVNNPLTRYTAGPSPYDWFTTVNDNGNQNNDLWGGVGSSGFLHSSNGKSVYDPCPEGYRVPKNGEWPEDTWDSAENGRSNDEFGGYYPLAGYRYGNQAGLNVVGSNGYYWSATQSTSNTTNSFYLTLYSNGTVYPSGSASRATGFSVRCRAE